MNLPHWLTRFWIVRNKEENTLNFQVNLEVLQTMSEYELYERVPKLIAEKVCEDIAPDIKNKLLGNKEFTKLLNEIRLLQAKKIMKD